MSREGKIKRKSMCMEKKEIKKKSKERKKYMYDKEKNKKERRGLARKI
jgi:hypothetical protein